MISYEEMKTTANQLRKTVINMIFKARSGHPGGSLSCAEILTVLYDRYLNVRPEQPDWEERDRFILSKGHAAPALYATLARKGFIKPELLETLRTLGSPLQGHPCMNALPGIDMSSGSLGLGLSVGVGMSLAAIHKNLKSRVYVLCGDGELQEGQNWEAFMSVSKWKPVNLTVIIDYNGVQLDGTTDEIMPLGDLACKIQAFGLPAISCDGHSIESLVEAIDSALSLNSPAVIIAKTVKGKGVSFMEGKSEWHGKQISEDEYIKAIRELEEVLS